MTWYKRLATRIQIIFMKAEINENLRQLNVGLETENSKLKDVIVEQTDLVLQYKRGMQQMREYMNAMVQMQSEIERFEEEHEEEEGATDPYELLRKKTTIH